ncbi:MAG TPA: ATP-binding protein, partial [Ktedonobacterales bacterium]|nr:ATP-binding protein [Ktedonobacterales bacterium]
MKQHTIGPGIRAIMWLSFLHFADQMAIEIPPMLFLERDSLLQTLAKSLDQMRAGQGITVLISGEAGIGKTSLVEQFV